MRIANAENRFRLTYSQNDEAYYEGRKAGNYVIAGIGIYMGVKGLAGIAGGIHKELMLTGGFTGGGALAAEVVEVVVISGSGTVAIELLTGGRIVLSAISNGGPKTSSIPVKDKVRAGNGLDYKSNPKHTPGHQGFKPDAGIEPKNSLELFEKSVASTRKPNQRFTFDSETNTLHRFFNDGNGTWHWSGSTNQGVNSITGDQVPNDIKNYFGLPKKGW